MKVLVVLALALCVVAQNETGIPEGVAMQLQGERMLTRGYIDTLLKIQHSQMSIQAANDYSSVLVRAQAAGMVQTDEASAQAPSFEEQPTNWAGINGGSGGFPAYGAAGFTPEVQAMAERTASPRAAMLTGSYQLFYATKMKFYQTVFKSADIQNEFWIDRAYMVYLGAQAEAADPNLVQYMYIKLYRTNLETLKLSLSFQYLSHFVTWFEDELDVNGGILESDDETTQIAILMDQTDDLIRDRMYAFSAFNSYAQLDFQTFYFDLFLESMGTGSLGGGSSLGSSFVEEESTTKPFTDVLATGSFGAGQQSPMFLKMYRFYFLLFQMYSAHAGFTGAYADHAAHQMGADGPKAEEFKRFGFQMLYGSFSSNLRYAAQLEYISGLYDLYLMFQSTLASSFGSSLGSLGSL